MSGRVRRRLAAWPAAVVLLMATACGGSRDTALSSAADSLNEQARDARGAFQAELELQRGQPPASAEQALRTSLAGNSSAGARALVEEERSEQSWRIVALYEAQRPYSSGFTSDELVVAGCLEYTVRLPDLVLEQARPTDCPEPALAGVDEAVRIEL